MRMILDELLRRNLSLTEEELLHLTSVLGHLGLRGWMANPPVLVRLFERYAVQHGINPAVRRGLETAREIVYWATANAERRRMMERFDALLSLEG